MFGNDERGVLGAASPIARVGAHVDDIAAYQPDEKLRDDVLL